MMAYSSYPDLKPEVKNGLGPKGNSQGGSDKFKLLLPSEAYGLYHVNHYHCCFRLEGSHVLPADKTSAARVMTHRFHKHFCKIFSANNIARAQLGPTGLDKHKWMNTVEFHLGGNLGNAEQLAIGFVHPDWVGMERFGAALQDADEEVDTDILTNGIQSFCGNTLFRNWDTPIEALIRKGETSTPGLVVDAFTNPTLFLFDLIKDREIEYALYVNRHHFLSGTRSWGVFYDSTMDVYIVETAAIERNSLWEYAELEKHVGSRDDIDILWCRLLLNFLSSTDITHNKMRLVPPPSVMFSKYGYRKSTIEPLISQRAWNFKSLAGVESSRQSTLVPVREVLRRHEGLRVHVPGV